MVVNQKQRHLYLFMLGSRLLVLVCIWSCAYRRDIAFVGHAKAPCIDGLVQLRRVRNESRWKFTISLDGPSPTNFGSDYHHYIVWLYDASGTTLLQPMQPMNYDPSVRRATTHMTTQTSSMILKISVERSTHVTKPSDTIVVTKPIEIK